MNNTSIYLFRLKENNDIPMKHLKNVNWFEHYIYRKIRDQYFKSVNYNYSNVKIEHINFTN